MDARLIAWLSSHTETTDYYTHTSQLVGSSGRYKIETKDMETFWNLYCDMVFQDGNNFIAGLSEKPLDYMPILADIDLSFTEDEQKDFSKPFYSAKHINHMIEIYRNVIMDVVQGWKPENLICFVLEKSKPQKTDIRYKNGFHLHFPWLYLSQIDQEVHIQPRIQKAVEEEKVFADLGIAHSSKNVDKDLYKKHWLLYGCRKASTNEAYKVTRIVDHRGDDLQIDEIFKYHKLYDTDECEIKIDKPAEYYLPRILSVHSSGKPGCRNFKCITDQQYIENSMKDKLVKAKDNKQVFENMKLPEILSIAKRLMKMVNPERADHHDTWMHVGWTLFNICDGCQEGLDMWIEFSKNVIRRKHVDEARCVWEWNKMEKRNITLGCLRFLARNDSPDQYRDWEEEVRNERIAQCLTGGQNNLARQLHDIVGDFFICASIKREAWYEFKNHRWTISDAGITLRQRITTDIIPRFNVYIKSKQDELKTRKRQRMQAGDEEPEEEEETLEKNNKEMKALVAKLNSHAFKKGIISECQEYFYNSEFLQNIDSDPYLLGFKNGVLDLRYGEFRDGKPTDYITMSTNYDFKHYNWDSLEVEEVQIVLDKLFPDRQLKQYFIEYCARLLKGYNEAKTFNCWTGVGDNGKSIAEELIEKAFGMYSIKFPTSLITQKRGQSSAASPELARTNGVRVGFVQEPDSSDSIYAGTMKEMTGNDTFVTRPLFGEFREIKPMFKLILICNKLPRLQADDTASWNRVRVLPFESRFPKNNKEVPTTWDEQMKKKVFYRDPMLSEKLEAMRQPFMWMIFETYKYCSKNGWMQDPSKVTDATEQYRESNDYTYQFINERIIQDGKEGVLIHLNEFYAEFKNWFNTTYTGIKLPSKIDIRDDLNKKWGPNINGRYKYYRFRTIEDDEAEGKAQILRDEDFASADEEDW